jgi:hypothetical protein
MLLAFLNPTEIQILISLAGIFGAGAASFFGVKASLARMEAKQESQKECIDDLCDRVTFIERNHMKGA